MSAPSVARIPLARDREKLVGSGDHARIVRLWMPPDARGGAGDHGEHMAAKILEAHGYTTFITQRVGKASFLGANNDLFVYMVERLVVRGRQKKWQRHGMFDVLGARGEGDVVGVQAKECEEPPDPDWRAAAELMPRAITPSWWELVALVGPVWRMTTWTGQGWVRRLWTPGEPWGLREGAPCFRAT